MGSGAGRELGIWTTSTQCNVTYKFSTVLPAPEPGGAASVEIWLGDLTTSFKCESYNRP